MAWVRWRGVAGDPRWSVSPACNSDPIGVGECNVATAIVACSTHRVGRVGAPAPQEFVDAAVEGTREHLDRTIAFLMSQPPEKISDETWTAFERMLERVDETFEWLRDQGYRVAH